MNPRRTGAIPRRRVLVAAAAAGAAALSGRAISVNAQPSQPKTPVTFDVPPGACDCHTHVFGDPARFPFAAGRRYTPETATVEELRALHRTLGVSRVVVVQPSVYGTDNACTLDAIRQLGPGARGVAVIDEATPAATLAEMQRAGIRGIRLNLETSGETDPAVARRRFQRAVEQIQGLDWHIQLYTRPAVVEGLRELIMEAPVRVVFDHFAGAQAASGTGQPGVAALAGAGARRQGLREAVRAVSRVEAVARLSRRRAPRHGPGGGEPGTHAVGDQLAASQLVAWGRPHRRPM